MWDICKPLPPICGKPVAIKYDLVTRIVTTAETIKFSSRESYSKFLTKYLSIKTESSKLIVSLASICYHTDMKTSKDPRHKERIKIVQELFAWDFSKENNVENPKAKEIVDQLDKIDMKIGIAAPLWPIDKINKMDLAILRLAVYELGEKKVPEKVILDEAIELAKEFGSESSPSFVNGALGKLLN